MNKELEVVLSLYEGLIATKTNDGIPVCLRPADVVGTVQDDPFDCWIEEQLKQVLPDNYEVVHAGKLTTPDIIIREKQTNTIVGLEIKKLIQKANGKDPRGLTIDYNSCLPCGRAMVKVGKDTTIVPCYYLFALLNPNSTEIITLIIMDGDFLNYDFELHKEAKYSNFTEYNHGSYGEGSVRHRKMYTYPNPLNSDLSFFSFRQLFVAKRALIDGSHLNLFVKEEVERTDKYGNSFYYSLVDKTNSPKSPNEELTILKDIFSSCKKRQSKERVAYIPEIPVL
ncbi:MAG: hypothetical protein NC048_01045 [Bacteroides sp.]|nr:hypothetical protein [Bacteroides sp.]MCM1531999.1 hypothetical protein [Ruminococcus flavefaciens]MCM1554066.1 hypothetical protein [Bacteroides sp.]